MPSPTRPKNRETPRRGRRTWTKHVVAAIVITLALGAVLIGARSQHAKPAKSTISAPRPCVVGTPGCGPLPTLPTEHTPMPQDAHLRGRPRPGLLRPGTYDRLGIDGIGWHLVFTVPSGWRWNGQTLSKGNAAIYFAVGPVLVYKDPCHWDRPQHPSPDSSTPGSIESTAAALAAQPMRYPTRPRLIPSSLAGPLGPGDSTVGIRWTTTVEIRLTVPSNIDLSRCDHGEYRTWRSAHSIRSQQGPGQRDLIAIADPDRRLFIDAATFPDTPTRVVHQVDAILASVRAGDWG